MRNSFQQLFLCTLGIAIFFILPGQPGKNTPAPDPSLPVQLTKQLDSFRRADDLAGWLLSYREYVSADPAKRISLLEKARSNAWRQSVNDAERLEWFNGLATQGYYLLYNGNILRSIDAYEKAYRFYFDQPIPGADVLEYVLKPLGNNYTRLGDYDRAFFIQEKSLKLAQQNDSAQIAPICHNLATTAIWKEDFALAQQYCEIGLSRVQYHSALHGLLLSTLAEVLLRSGKTDSAETTIRSAVSILTPYLSDAAAINAPYWLRGALQGLGDIEKEKGEYPAALASYQKAIDIIDRHYKGGRKREKAQLTVSCGHVLLQMRQQQKAITRYDEALMIMMPSYQPRSVDELPDAKDIYGENTLLDALHGKADCLHTLGKNDAALQCYMLLYVVEKKLRNEFFSSTAKQQQQKENRNWVEPAIEVAYELWGPERKKEYAEKILLIAEMSKAQLLLDEMKSNLRFNRMKNQDSLLNKEQQLVRAITYYEREGVMNRVNGQPDSNAEAAKKTMQFELSLVQKQVKEKYPLQEGLVMEAFMPSADSLLQHIPDNTRVVEFFEGRKNSYIIEAVKDSVLQVRKLEDAAQVRQSVKDLVFTYFQQGPGNMMNSPEQYCREAYTLYHRLWPGGLSKKQEHCIIIPDGIFGYLPFDALVTDPAYIADPGQWPYLVNQTNLYYSYSLQTARQQEQAKQRHQLFAGYFVSFDSSQQSALPSVKKEYDAIHDVVAGDFFSDMEATLAAFNKSLPEVNLLHISTHSFLQGKENMPVLQLADDKFFLFELYGKNFQPQLVVLSACRTGHGMLAEGEGIISLARGFTTTGAEGIIAGLWNMNDETTAELTGSFYRQLADLHLPADALHAAKLEWLKKPGGDVFQKLPYFWAGMVYSGDNLAVDIQTKKTLTNFWWIAVTIAAGLLFFLWRRRLIGNGQ